MKTEDFSTLDPRVRFEQKGIAATKFIISPDPLDFAHAERWRELFAKAPRLLMIAENVLIVSQYPNGSKAQVAALAELCQDVENLLE